MFARISKALEERRWAACEAVTHPADALPRADAAADRLRRAKKIQSPGARADAVMERNIARPTTAARQGLRLLACAPTLTLPTVQRYAEAWMQRAAQDKVCVAGDAPWILGVLAQRRPDAFELRLGGLLATLPEAIGAEGSVLHAGVLEGIARGLGRGPLKAALLKRIEAHVARRWPALGGVLTRHTETDPALCGATQPEIPAPQALVRLRQLRQLCLDAVRAQNSDALALAEAMAHTSAEREPCAFVDAASLLLGGQADGLAEAWARVTRVIKAHDWVGLVHAATALYDRDEGPPSLDKLLADAVADRVGRIPAVAPAAFDRIAAAELPGLIHACLRLTRKHDVWRRFFPAQTGWLAGRSRAEKLERAMTEYGAGFSPDDHALVGIVRGLMQANTCPGPTCETSDQRTTLALRDTLGDFLIDHRDSSDHVAMALAVFEPCLSPQGRVRGVLAEAAARLLRCEPAKRPEPMLRLAQALAEGSDDAVRETYLNAVFIYDEKTVFHLHEWLCLGEHGQRIVNLCSRTRWSRRLQAHVLQSSTTPWQPLHLDAWQPNQTRLHVYAEVLYRIIPHIEDANERAKARDLMAFLVASEGPARAISVTQFRGRANLQTFSPHPDVAYASMRAYCHVMGLACSSTINVSIGDARVVAHGDFLPDISRFVATASDEIGRALVVAYQGCQQQQAQENVLKILGHILGSGACLDGWVTSLHEMIKSEQLNLDGTSLDMVLDLQGKRSDNDRCSEYLRVFQLTCGMQYRKAQGLPAATPMAAFEADERFVRDWFNATTFEQYLEKERFHTQGSLADLVAWQVENICILQAV